MKNNGFTLVEIILSITLIAILFALSSIVLRQGLDTYSHISKRGPNLQDARYAMERMVRELRREGDDSTDQIQNISSTQIGFTDDQGNNTSFNLSGQTLLRGSDILLRNVTALTFTGYKSDNTTTSAAPQVRRVQIQLTTIPPGQTAPLTLQTNVFLRNYMYENWQ